MATILIIGKDPVLSSAVQQALAVEPHTFRFSESLDRLPYLAAGDVPALLVVDLMSFGPDVASVILRIRSASALERVPMLCLGRGETASMVAQILDAGGDDYLRKPFVPREIAARVRALLRRSTRNATAPGLILDADHYAVQINGQHVALTPTEFVLLETLCQSAGDHLSAEELLERVWHYPPGRGDPALVRNHVRNLRRKLERDPNRPRIVTSSHGRGYTISAELLRR
ncbi:MAG: response regulator transcription factor [Anaerolineae bacterium]|nr:response regulator transcription factor [Anaerolineae bacterium]